MRPEFGCGINQLVFAPNNTQTATLIAFHVNQALMKWEPRIEVLNVDAHADEDEKNKLIINIEYMIKTTNTRDNMVYPFYLEKGGLK
jgi:phage baseplate assembly protein W